EPVGGTRAILGADISQPDATLGNVAPAAGILPEDAAPAVEFCVHVAEETERVVAYPDFEVGEWPWRNGLERLEKRQPGNRRLGADDQMAAALQKIEQRRLGAAQEELVAVVGDIEDVGADERRNGKVGRGQERNAGIGIPQRGFELFRAPFGRMVAAL